MSYIDPRTDSLHAIDPIRNNVAKAISEFLLEEVLGVNIDCVFRVS